MMKIKIVSKIVLVISLTLTSLIAKNDFSNLTVPPIEQFLSNSDEYVETNLKTFTIDVLSNINKSFVIQDDMSETITMYYKPNQHNLSFLKQILKQNDYSIKQIDNIYYIKKIEKEDEIEEDLKVRYINLNFLNYNDIESIFKLFDIQYSYLKETNKIAIKSNLEDFNYIQKQLSQLDVLPTNQRVRLSIFETNLGDLKSRQGIINLNFNKSQKALFDIFLGSSFQIKNDSDVDNINSIFKFLDSNNLTKTLTSTVINLEHNKKFDLNSSQNVPFLITSNTINDTKINEVNSYDYKDVGLQIDIVPKILNDLINLDLKFNYSQLLSNTDNLPVTTKKSLTQNITLTKTNKLFILNGINNYSKKFNNEKIPLLSDIPLIGSFFENKNADELTTTTTILIELLDTENIDDLRKVETVVVREFDGCKFLELCE